MKVEAGDKRAIRTDLTPEEQIRIQKENAQLDRIIDGLMEENKKVTALKES